MGNQVTAELESMSDRHDELQSAVRDGHFGNAYNEFTALVDANDDTDFLTPDKLSDWKTVSTHLRSLTSKRKQLTKNKELVLNAVRNASDAIKNATDLISAILSQVDEAVESDEESDEDSSDENDSDISGVDFGNNFSGSTMRLVDSGEENVRSDTDLFDAFDNQNGHFDPYGEAGVSNTEAPAPPPRLGSGRLNYARRGRPRETVGRARTRPYRRGGSRRNN